jgi:hypothetical protein
MRAMSDSDLEADLKATLAARRELGEEYDAALAQSFLEKLDREIDARVEAALSVRDAAVSRPRVRRRSGGSGLAIMSIALGIPVSAVVASNLHGVDSLLGVVVAWAAIAAINVVHAIDRRPAR